jgi:hypothetical protein
MTMRQQLDSGLKQRISQLEHYAQNVPLEEREFIAQRLKRVFPDIETVHTFEPSALPTLNQSNAGISFAGIDLVRKVAAGERVKVDAYFENKVWRFQLGARIPNADGTLNSVLLATFNVDDLRRQFFMPVDSDGMASVLASEGGRAIFSAGSPGDGAPVSMASGVSQWTIVYQPANQYRTLFDRVLIVVLFSVPAVLAVLPVFMMVRNQARRVGDAVKASTQYLRSVANGEMQKPKDVIFTEIKVLNTATAQAIRDLIKRLDEAKKKEATATPRTKGSGS